MWLITYHVIPKPGTPNFEKVGGAYVNCWILFAWQDGAELLAKHEVEKEWTITEPPEISWYDPGDIEPDNPSWEYYEQATIDGGCFVFHTYDDDDEEADEDIKIDDDTSQPSKLSH